VQGLRKISMALRKENTGMKHLPQAWSTCHNGMAQETDAAILCAAVNERSWCSMDLILFYFLFYRIYFILIFSWFYSILLFILF
jgi:hypothetical protein